MIFRELGDDIVSVGLALEIAFFCCITGFKLFETTMDGVTGWCGLLVKLEEIVTAEVVENEAAADAAVVFVAVAAVCAFWYALCVVILGGL